MYSPYLIVRDTLVLVSQIMRIQLFSLENACFSQPHYQNTFCILCLKLPFLHFNYIQLQITFPHWHLIIVSKGANIRTRNT